MCSTWHGDSFDIASISIASETVVKADWFQACTKQMKDNEIGENAEYLLQYRNKTKEMGELERTE